MHNHISKRPALTERLPTPVLIYNCDYMKYINYKLITIIYIDLYWICISNITTPRLPVILITWVNKYCKCNGMSHLQYYFRDEYLIVWGCVLSVLIIGKTPPLHLETMKSLSATRKRVQNVLQINKILTLMSFYLDNHRQSLKRGACVWRKKSIVNYFSSPAKCCYSWEDWTIWKFISAS